MIDVVLDDRFSGEQVVSSFARAGSFDVGEDIRWRVYEKTPDYRYSKKSGLFIARRTLYALPEFNRKIGLGLVGPKRWINGAANITLEPINLMETYEKVGVNVWAQEHDENERLRSTNDPESEVFKPYRPYLERILGGFTTGLSSI